MSAPSDCTESIDIVITWVDGSDSEWKRERAKYTTVGDDSSIRDVDSRDSRFCPWDTLRYLFRGIEEYASWVRTVHFVTWGHLPQWINQSNPRLNIVRHEAFIPAKYLPTFSSHTIEFNLHRIEGLAERFVYFNDDMFLLRETKASDFFRNGLPCDAASLSPHRVVYGDWFYTPVTNMAIINKHYNVHETIARNPLKWLNLKYHIDVLRTLLMLPYPYFYGIRNYHIPSSLLKTTFQQVWEAEPEILDETCSHRFRVSTDPNPWLLQEWQVASGNFAPRSVSFGEQFHIHDIETARNASKHIHARRSSLVCVNDSDESSEECRQLVEDALATVFPKRSSFEL